MEKRNPYLWQCAGALFLILVTASCGGPNPTLTPGVQTHPIPTNEGPGGNAQPTTTTAGATAAAQPTTTGSMPVSNGPVSLQVLTPQDGAVVNTPQIQVSGTASPGAVVSVNDAVIMVGADGTFSATVALDSGPNLVEVIASSSSGDTKTVDLTITYQQ